MTKRSVRLNNRFGNYCQFCGKRIKNPRPDHPRIYQEIYQDSWFYQGFICRDCFLAQNEESR